MRTYGTMSATIRQLDEAGTREAGEALGELLSDAVAAGASVGFLADLEPSEAVAWWRDGVASRVGSGSVVLLVAEEDGQIAGTVQLVLPTYPNGRFRAEVAKLIVHSSRRRRGLARALMAAVEEAAHAAGRTLLVLDTDTVTGAEKLYSDLGWTVAGVIPDFALSTTGHLHPTTVMYRRLD